MEIKFYFQNEKVVLLPKQADLWAVPVHYEHLWKIRAPVENVEGFKMDHFDNIIMVCLEKNYFFITLSLLSLLCGKQNNQLNRKFKRIPFHFLANMTKIDEFTNLYLQLAQGVVPCS